MRVVTYNLHAGRPAAGRVDIRRAGAVLQALAPDFCALQEVVSWPPPLRYLDQARRLARITGLHARFRASFGVRPIGFGNAVLSRPRPLTTRRLWLPGRGEPRSVLHARFAGDEAPFHLLSTHLSLSPADRLRQCRFLARYVRRLPGAVILAGDLNAAPGSAELELLLETGLRSAAAAPTFPSSQPRVQLDYILLSEHWQVEAWAAPEADASDHLPLLADLILRPPGSPDLPAGRQPPG